MPTNNPTLIILDGNSILYRAFYATYIPDMPVLKTSFGVPTNAIMNLANMLIGIITTYNPDYMAVAYDAGKHACDNGILTSDEILVASLHGSYLRKVGGKLSGCKLFRIQLIIFLQVVVA